MNEEEMEYGIELCHSIDVWNKCTAKIPNGVKVDDSDTMFVKVLDENDECVYAAKKVDVIYWRQYPLEEEEITEEDELIEV